MKSSGAAKQVCRGTGDFHLPRSPHVLFPRQQFQPLTDEHQRSESRRDSASPQGIPPELSNLSGVGLLRATSNFAGPLDISWQISLFSFESSGKGLTSENKACIITAIRIYIFIQSILGGDVNEYHTARYACSAIFRKSDCFCKNNQGLLLSFDQLFQPEKGAGEYENSIRDISRGNKN